MRRILERLLGRERYGPRYYVCILDTGGLTVATSSDTYDQAHALLNVARRSFESNGYTVDDETGLMTQLSRNYPAYNLSVTALISVEQKPAQITEGSTVN